MRYLLPTVLLLSTLSYMSCMKKPDHKPEYGNEVELSAINNALNELNVGHVTNVKLNEFWALDTVYYIDRGNPTVVSQTNYLVMARNETASAVSLTYKREHATINSNGDKVMDVPLEQTLTFSKPASVSSLQSPSLTTEKLSVFKLPRLISPRKPNTFGMSSIVPLASTQNDEPVRNTFHDLKVVRSRMAVPQSIREKPNCGGMQNCDSMAITTVSFNMVFWYNDGSSEILRWRITTSPDMPYMYRVKEGFMFPGQLVYCNEQYIEYQEKQFAPVMVCEETSDFTFGTN